MASDLISRDALLAEYDRVHVGEPGGARKLIEKAPAVDAEPVRHGYWIEYVTWIGAFGQIHSKCSVCGTIYNCKRGSRGNGKGGKFCEECGAKMDGGIEND